MHSFWLKNGIEYTLDDFFTNSSGHPDCHIRRRSLSKKIPTAEKSHMYVRADTSCKAWIYAAYIFSTFISSAFCAAKKQFWKGSVNSNVRGKWLEIVLEMGAWQSKVSVSSDSQSTPLKLSRSRQKKNYMRTYICASFHFQCSVFSNIDRYICTDEVVCLALLN
jgi:hypothetical protein